MNEDLELAQKKIKALKDLIEWQDKLIAAQKELISMLQERPAATTKAA